ncbi:RbsD/FucU family protein [Ideonella sp. A 288]|uniref:RbsD/FucU family protein n=1 Tax=Ideonella sp. A 288 TaxID=1962181 RepID=UPI000B4A8F77|nr:RbsD/FucU domain-containing protein [Ideonella sp. A 288]
MLKGIDPLLTPELLKVLAEMGHGDEIVVADANFTAHSLAAGKPVLSLAGAGVERAVVALTSLLPLDDGVAQPVAYMHVSGKPEGWRSALQRAVIGALESRGCATAAQCEAVERFAFYERVQSARAIVLTGEMQPYANFILKKGVIGEALVE